VSEDKTHLDNILLSYNLISIINFPTRVQNAYSTAIDSIFIDVTQYESYTVTPITNGLSDHDAQFLKVCAEYTAVPIHKFKTVRNINKYAILDFTDKLCCESCDTVFDSEDVNAMFNSFLNIYLRIFYSSFPLIKVINRNNKDNKSWITIGIKTSCRRKRELYLTCRNSNNLELKRHYQVYCKILANVIQEANRIYYDKKN
jgi:hypothetical protein